MGFIGLNGTLNQAITIRSFISRNGELWFQAGGGIVAASNEEYELQEVNNKLGALSKAILLAENPQQVLNHHAYLYEYLIDRQLRFFLL